jgi:prepilin-type N-terminal cleavage/methylation domain-containing protein
MKVVNQFGFSLLEILIAMALLSIMMVSIVQITSTGIDTKEKILAEDNEFTQAETALGRISEDIYQIYSPLYFSNKQSAKRTGDESAPKIKYVFSQKYPSVSSKGQPIPSVESPDRQTLIFFSSSNRRKIKGSKESTYAWVKYALRNMEGERNPEAPYELVRYFDTKNIYDGSFKFDDIKPSILQKNIKSMDINYWDPDRKKFVDSIREISGDSKLITGVEINLTWLDKLGMEKTIKRIILPQWPPLKPPSPEEDIGTPESEGTAPEEPADEN